MQLENSEERKVKERKIDGIFFFLFSLTIVFIFNQIISKIYLRVEWELSDQ